MSDVDLRGFNAQEFIVQQNVTLVGDVQIGVDAYPLLVLPGFPDKTLAFTFGQTVAYRLGGGKYLPIIGFLTKSGQVLVFFEYQKGETLQFSITHRNLVEITMGKDLVLHDLPGLQFDTFLHLVYNGHRIRISSIPSWKMNCLFLQGPKWVHPVALYPPLSILVLQDPGCCPGLPV
jgi:hypothetical protein